MGAAFNVVFTDWGLDIFTTLKYPLHPEQAINLLFHVIDTLLSAGDLVQPYVALQLAHANSALLEFFWGSLI